MQEGERLAMPRRCPEVMYDTIMFPLWISSTQERLMAGQARDALRNALSNDQLMTSYKTDVEEDAEEDFVPLQQYMSDDRYAVMETNPSYVPVTVQADRTASTGSRAPSTSKSHTRKSKGAKGPVTTVNFAEEDPWMVNNPSYVPQAPGQDEPSNV